MGRRSHPAASTVARVSEAAEAAAMAMGTATLQAEYWAGAGAR